jgi:hypothetical protein
MSFGSAQASRQIEMAWHLSTDTPKHKDKSYFFTPTTRALKILTRQILPMHKVNYYCTLVATHFGAGEKVARIFRQVPSAMALGLFSLRVDGQAAGQHGVGGSRRDADARDVPPRHGQQQRYEPQSHQLCACRTRNRVRFVLARLWMTGVLRMVRTGGKGRNRLPDLTFSRASNNAFFRLLLSN